MKTCSKCSCPQEDVQFYKQEGNRDGLKGWCKTCTSLYGKERSKNRSPEQRKARNDRESRRRRAKFVTDSSFPEAVAKRKLTYRKENLKRNYGATLDTWSRMLADQAGVCDICKTVPTGKKGFVVDHDHTTGKLRGLLCAQCNSALGFLKDSPTIAESLIRYINKHNQTPVEDEIKDSIDDTGN